MISALVERKRMAILKAFLDAKSQDPNAKLYLNEISKETDIPPSTCLRILAEMKKVGIVKQSTVSRMKLYYIDSDKLKYLESLLAKEEDPVSMFVNEVSKESGIRMILLHERDDEKANVLLIGTNIRSDHIKIISAEIREKFGFNITHMVMTHEQYGQMKELNLFKGKVEELYRAPI